MAHRAQSASRSLRQEGWPTAAPRSGRAAPAAGEAPERRRRKERRPPARSPRWPRRAPRPLATRAPRAGA
ncbi:MAG: hypothetical protein E6J79_13350 [Deltaproteobacteria bacterium]|nr:MAG: hypothetical protein E6J79_13350 [Deltaproteobacteria bacterium]